MGVNKIFYEDRWFLYRDAIPSDMESVFSLIKELAQFENSSHLVTNTVEQLLADGFGSNPAFGIIVAKSKQTSEIVGMSFYYFRYSTWQGKCLYIEDLIVSEPHRRQGIGKTLLALSAEMAKQTDCTHMRWQVLDWNTSAVDFYERNGAKVSKEWWNVDAGADAIKTLANHLQ